MKAPRAEVERAFSELLEQVDRLVPGADAAAEGGDRGAYLGALADLVGYLAERMTELHRKRQEETRAFLSWLEERLSCPVDDLSGKRYVLAYYEQPEGVEKLLEVIEQNYPLKHGLDITTPAAYGARNAERDRIVEGYERSMACLRPVLRQVALTDGLIDLLVYRLYGLTEEEVEVVERSTSGV